jgi:16S rRNA (uracil1498-N3)-methyltransferase
VVERLDPPRVITFFSEDPVIVGEVRLSDAAAHHAHVRRVAPGDEVTLTDGKGTRGIGRVQAITKKDVVAAVDRVEGSPSPPQIHLFLPVADRDRMLWLAEKAAELQIATWNPVVYRRSKSVSPRGEGDAFERKVRARMISAVEQSGGAWLPEARSSRDVDALEPTGKQLVMGRDGRQLAGVASSAPISLAIGPEGGIEPDELQLLIARGWAVASLGDITLRFETAAVAAIAIARSAITPERQE